MRDLSKFTDICPVCAGSGEGMYSAPVALTTEFETVLRDCSSCYGSGFKRGPLFMQLEQGFASARESIASIDASLEAAYAAMSLPFGGRKS